MPHRRSCRRIRTAASCLILAFTPIVAASTPQWHVQDALCSLHIEADPPIGEWRQSTSDENGGTWTSTGGYELSVFHRGPRQDLGLQRSGRPEFLVTRYALTCSVPLGGVAAVFDTTIPPGPSVFRQAPQVNVAFDARPNAGIPFLMACDHYGRSSVAVGAVDQQGTYRVAGQAREDRYVVAIERREYGREWFQGTELFDSVYVSTEARFWFDAARAYADAVDAYHEYSPIPIPPYVYQPYYSTWYAFGAKIDTSTVWENAVIARDMGVGNFLIFIGWSTCEDWFNENNEWGDYEPCSARFEDFAGLVKRLTGELGLPVQLWIAPTWIGSGSKSFTDMKGFRSKWPGGGYDRNLDPRSPQAREHIRAKLTSLARRYGVQGVYLDFLDTLYNRNDADHEKHPRLFGTAYASFLEACYYGFASKDDQTQSHWGPPANGPMVELRIPFANLLGKRYANVFNTTYVDGDWERNRLLAIMLRPFSHGVAHRTDPVVLKPEQLRSRDEIGKILSASILCGPPGISMDLARLDPGVRKQLSDWLAFYRSHADHLSRGTLRPFGREYHYPEMMVTFGTTSYARVSRWETDEIPLPAGTRHAFIFTCLPEDVSFIARVDLTRVTGLVPGKYRARWYDSSLEAHDGDFELEVQPRPVGRAGDEPILTPREYWDFVPDESRPSLDIRRGGFLELQLIE